MNVESYLDYHDGKEATTFRMQQFIKDLCVEIRELKAQVKTLQERLDYDEEDF